MSINKLLEQGVIGNGLDIQCKSANVNNIYVQNISDPDEQSYINFSNNTINITSNNTQINGDEILTLSNGCSNPLVETLNANNNNIINVTNIATNQIFDQSNLSQIFMNPTDISIFTDELKLNGNEVLTSTTGVKNPMTSDLDANSKKIVGVDRMTVSSISDYSEQRVIDFDTAGEIQVYASVRTTINSSEVLLNSIKDYDTSTSIIDFTVPDEITLTAPVNINLDALTVKINNNNVLTTPLQENLDANVKDILNANTITTGNIASVDYTRFIDFTLPNIISLISPTSIRLDTIDILQNLRTKQLVDIHSNNNTYAGLSSAVGNQYCTSYGNLSGSSISGDSNTAIGYSAYKQGATGNFNSACGTLSLFSASTCDRNSAYGAQSLYNCMSGNYNVGVGYSGGFGIQTGNFNIAIGHQSNDSIADNGNCNNCIAIGAQSRTNGNATNSIVLGYGVISSISNECIIGNGSVSIIRNAGNGVCDLGTNNNKFKDLYLSGNINGITPAGGVWMQLTSGGEITNTTTETSLLSGSTSLGSLVVGANASTQSAFQLVLYGTFGAVATHDLTIRIKMGATTIATLSMTNLVAVSGEHFEIESDYSITDLTSPTLASITTNLEFTYSNGTSSFVGDRIVNTTTFNSTISNTISITAEWGSASGSDKIQCLRGTLRKTY